MKTTAKHIKFLLDNDEINKITEILFLPEHKGIAIKFVSSGSRFFKINEFKKIGERIIEIANEVKNIK